MANRIVFYQTRGPQVLPATDWNSHFAAAYGFSPKHALAQFAVTGCLNQTFYASAHQQLERLLSLAHMVESEFLAKLAVFCRTGAFMKDTPALLCAVLANRREHVLLERIFERVIDNTGMLRNYIQILRSGATGRKSLGTAPKRLVEQWLSGRSEEVLFRQSVGQSPSLADVIRMVHPKPATDTRKAFYGYLLGRPVEDVALPALVRQFERCKTGEVSDLPELPLPMLTSLPLRKQDWARLARGLSWQALRMNLNTLARQGVFEDADTTEYLAEKLRDRNSIERARVFPYQLLAAYKLLDDAVPELMREALHAAMEIATENVPRVHGQVYVCVDVSGSMASPVTGHRRGATTAIRCVDVAALAASAILRANPGAKVIPFEQDVVELRLNSRDRVLENAAKLAAVGGGGTNCSAPLRMLNAQRAKGDLVVFLSDNESWVDVAPIGSGTTMMREWQAFRERNPQARLACVDLQPNHTTQTYDRTDVLNIGGFSDHVFTVIAEFTEGRLHPDHWVGQIEAMEV